jgi:hypothetical protein
MNKHITKYNKNNDNINIRNITVLINARLKNISL